MITEFDHYVEKMMATRVMARAKKPAPPGFATRQVYLVAVFFSSHSSGLFIMPPVYNGEAFGRLWE